MDNFFLKVQNNNSRSFLLVVILFAFFSSTTVFGQKENLEISTEEVLTNHNNIVIENPIKVSSSIINSNANFILWFMGTKENIGKTFSDDGMYSKKSFMTSGAEPNHLLVKTLLKKALNIKSC
ncbi:hypothetical protein [Flavobacterium sp. 5]|uniref:hypothetical protein n=1 Tax=Flavobacterium sp. 5 TaxID=2035199 RepID=UPI000C2C3F38|nr:hypothetical protein [Flavobacterium sp. 5]PKB15781.1 hypothetical protein CLU82_0875 [Flavobacterium sp. 5]